MNLPIQLDLFQIYWMRFSSLVSTVKYTYYFAINLFTNRMYHTKLKPKSVGSFSHVPTLLLIFNHRLNYYRRGRVMAWYYILWSYTLLLTVLFSFNSIIIRLGSNFDWCIQSTEQWVCDIRRYIIVVYQHNNTSGDMWRGQRLSLIEVAERSVKWLILSTRREMFGNRKYWKRFLAKWVRTLRVPIITEYTNKLFVIISLRLTSDRLNCKIFIS